MKFRPKTPFSPKKVSKSQPAWKVCIKIDGHASHVQLYSLGWQFSASQSQFFTSSPQCARPPHNGSWLHADVQLNRFHFDQPLKPFRGICAKEEMLKTSHCVWRWDCTVGCQKGKAWMKTLWVGRAHFQNPICVVVQNHTARKSNCARRSMIFCTLCFTVQLSFESKENLVWLCAAIWAVLHRCVIAPPAPLQCTLFGGDPCGDLCSKGLI